MFLLFSLIFWKIFFLLLLIFHSFFPSFVGHPSHSHLVMVIRLQVPRLALRRRLNALSGSVSRPARWRRRPIAFLCYILSASALRPLANRVRAAVSWLDSGKEGGAVNAYVQNEFISLSKIRSFLLVPQWGSYYCNCYTSSTI